MPLSVAATLVASDVRVGDVLVAMPRAARLRFLAAELSERVLELEAQQREESTLADVSLEEADPSSSPSPSVMSPSSSMSSPSSSRPGKGELSAGEECWVRVTAGTDCRGAFRSVRRPLKIPLNFDTEWSNRCRMRDVRELENGSHMSRGFPEHCPSSTPRNLEN